VRRRIVPELEHQRLLVERRLNDSSLHAAAAAVHDPDLVEPCLHGLTHVLDHDRRNVARRKGVEIELGFDRDSYRAAFFHSCACI
jgi:hypothetical protein